jgi:hypothetical protein
MKKFLLITTLFCLAIPSLAVTSNELVDNADRYDGQVIEYQGEVIGDVMIRRNHAWINVNDGGRAIGIFADKNLARQIKKIGSYNQIGDTVKIIGTFNRACADHGGDLDIHARELYVVQDGYNVEHPVNQAKLVIAGILFLAILATLIIPALIKRVSS